jgi:hypothetical protein
MLSMEMPLEKYSGFNFHTWKVKIQMQLMNKSLWGIVKGTEQAPRDPIKLDPNKLLEWKSRDDKAKAIIGLALIDSELHHVDLEKSSKEIWDTLNALFGAQAMNAKFSLKLQLFSFKMSTEITMSSHINNLRSILRQLAEVKVVVDEEDAKAILLNSLPSKYNNVIFTLSQLPSQSLEDMIVALLAEEKRAIAGDTEGDTQSEMAFYSRNNHNRSTKDKREIECYYCRKMGHITINCKIHANDLLKGKLKESTNIALTEDPPDTDNGEDFVEEFTF